jgi:hypothetical protein
VETFATVTFDRLACRSRDDSYNRSFCRLTMVMKSINQSINLHPNNSHSITQKSSHRVKSCLPDGSRGFIPVFFLGRVSSNGPLTTIFPCHHELGLVCAPWAALWYAVLAGARPFDSSLLLLLFPWYEPSSHQGIVPS